MDGAQNAIRFVHFSLQIPFECIYTAAFYPKFSDISFLRKSMYRCAFLMLRVLKMGSNILYFGVQIPLECTCIVIIIVMGCLASVVCRPGAESRACYGWRVGDV